ncbi:MAG: class I SAM-dependent methyltransferase [Candidatus Baldrarchaeia archaeon]
MEIKSVAKFYDEASSLYDGSDSLLDQHMYKEYEKEINSLDFSKKIVLDIGTGTGWPALEISKQRNSKIIGFDVSPGMIKIAKNKKKRNSIRNVDFIIASVEHIPFRPHIFDIVTCLGGVLNHIPHFNRAIRQIKQTLEKGGIFLFEFDNWKSFETLWRIFGFYGIREQKAAIKEIMRKGRIKKLNFPYIDTEGLKWVTNYYFDRDFVEETLIKNGFKILKVRGVHVLIPLLPPPIIGRIEKLSLLYLKALKIFEEKFSKHPSFLNLGISIIMVAKLIK